MKNHLLLIAALGAFATAGCAATRRATVQTFRSAPAGWTRVDGTPAALDVANCHLDLSRDDVLLDATVLGTFDGMVDVAFVGGDPAGFVGIVVVDARAADTGSVERPYLCLALRPGGEWRTYRATSPLDPIGGRGWQPAPGRSPTGFFRLGARATADAVELSVDHRLVDRIQVERGSADPPQYRVGIFTRAVVSRWKNFIAGDSAPSDPFRPEDLEFWGERGDAEALLAEAVRDAKRFRERPSRMGVYPVVASLEESRRIELAGTDAGGGASDAPRRSAMFPEFVEKIEKALSPHAARIGEAAFLESAFSPLREDRAVGSSVEGARFLEAAEAAEKGGDLGLAVCLLAAAEASGAKPSVAARIAALKDRLTPLRLDFEVESKASRPLFDPSAFWRAARETYGALPQSTGGELRIRTLVLRSSDESNSLQTQRRVRTSGADGARIAKVAEEREKLEKNIAEELVEAQARANILRAAAKLGGGPGATDLKTVSIDGKEHELLLDDADALAAAQRRLRELDRELAAEEGRVKVEYRSFPAKLTTHSLSVLFSVAVELDGARVMELERERVYRGLEQWEHAAHPELGVPASSVSREEVREATDLVERRVLRRFRDAISLESVASKLDAPDRVGFALRYARTTGLPDGRTLLEWMLQETVGLAPGLRTRVADMCLEP